MSRIKLSRALTLAFGRSYFLLGFARRLSDLLFDAIRDRLHFISYGGSVRSAIFVCPAVLNERTRTIGRGTVRRLNVNEGVPRPLIHRRRLQGSVRYR